MRFSEPVKGLELSELDITNGSALRMAPTYLFNEHGMTSWRVSVVPDSDFNGNVLIKVPAGAATDTFGNANTASEPLTIAARGASSSEGPKAVVSCRYPIAGSGSFGGRPAAVSVDVRFPGYYVDFETGPHPSDVPVLKDGVDVGRGIMICTGLAGAETCTYSPAIDEGASGTLLLQVLPGAVATHGGLLSRPSDPMYVAGDNWRVSVADASATEGTDETIDFEVSLNARDDCRAVTVDWATADGTATAGEDYEAASGTLTFATGESTKTVSVAVLNDMASEGDETVTLRLSNISGHEVEIGVAEATGTIQAPAALTARFANAPLSHDGSTPFTFELHFSEAPEGLSYTTVAGTLFEVTGASVTGARRLVQGDNQGWLVTVAPRGSDDIAISLPARACGEAAAVCTAVNRALSEGISATVQMEPESAQESEGALTATPFTAEYRNMPATHDGALPFTFELHFSEEVPDLSYKTVARNRVGEYPTGLLNVTGATINKSSRTTQGSNIGWSVTVTPTGTAAVTVGLSPRACTEAGAVCNSAGAQLAQGISATVAMGTPITLSIADATVEEGPDAKLDFVVSLSRAADHAVTGKYVASNGTAHGNVDYELTLGSFTIAVGETQTTVSVAVLDDSHDEGSETVIMTLYDVGGLTASQIADASAVGTITNSDPMPGAWITRFGRTVGSQVVDAVTSSVRKRIGLTRDHRRPAHRCVGAVRGGGHAGP